MSIPIRLAFDTEESVRATAWPPVICRRVLPAARAQAGRASPRAPSIGEEECEEPKEAYRDRLLIHRLWLTLRGPRGNLAR